MKHRNFLLVVKVEGMGWDCAGLLVAEPGPKQTEEMIALAKKPAAEVKECRAGGPEAIRTTSFLPPVKQLHHHWRAKLQLQETSLVSCRLSTMKTSPGPQHQEDTSIRLTMLRQESRLNPSVFRSLSEEKGGG